MRYKFDEKRHIHSLDEKPLTGCTTILSVLAKPALIQWSANMATDYVRQNLKDINDLEEILAEAKVAHRKKKEKAGDWGTEVHSYIEQYIKNLMNGKENEYNVSIDSFDKWVKDNNVTFLDSERNIYSETLWIGGIVDFVCKIDGEVWIGDIKTSKSGIYPEHFWQCAGYDLMLKDMKVPYADKVKGYLILNLKENGQFLEKRSVSNKDNIKAFKACLDIYRLQQKIKNQVI